MSSADDGAHGSSSVRTTATGPPGPPGSTASNAPAGSLPEGVRLTTLPSGVRVVTEHLPGVRSAAVGFWVGCGSRRENRSVAGATHFLEHLLFKGTRRRSAQDIAEALEAVGGDLNAFTSKEVTCFYARCLDRDLPLAIDVLGDMLTSTQLREEDVDAERQVVLEEIRLHQDTPDDLVHSTFAEALFGDHPLGREVLGDPATIGSIGRDDVAGWYRAQYVPGNVVVAVAGNVDHDEAVAQVGDALEGWQGVAPTADGPPAPSTPARGPLALARPTEQAHLVVGGLALPRSDERRFAARVLDQALGGGMSSRLFQEVRERRGLAYTVFSFFASHADTGAWGVYAGTAADQVDEVWRVIDQELERLREGGLEDEELARAKGGLSGALVLALEDPGSRMSRLGKSLVTDAPLLSLDDTVAAVERVGHEDVRGLAEELLGAPRTAALVGPETAVRRHDLEEVA